MLDHRNNINMRLDITENAAVSIYLQAHLIHLCAQVTSFSWFWKSLLDSVSVQPPIISHFTFLPALSWALNPPTISPFAKANRLTRGDVYFGSRSWLQEAAWRTESGLKWRIEAGLSAGINRGISCTTASSMKCAARQCPGPRRAVMNGSYCSIKHIKVKRCDG